MLRRTAIGLMFLCAGCASITAKPTETLYVSSTPPGAQVLVAGANRGQAPMPVELDRREPEPVELSLPGYPPQTCPVRMSPGTGYVVADVVLCVLLFPIGCISFIDAGGAWNELDHHTCNLALQPGYPAPQGAYPAPPQSYPTPPQNYPAPPQNYPPPPQSYPAPQTYPPPQSYPAPQTYPPPQSYPPPAPPRSQ